jgi:protein-disulfide isomerase
LRGAATRGDREAKVAVIEYADFESKSCAQFAVETLPAIDRAYISTGKLLWVFRNRPLTVHPNAEKAAEAAVCAAQQGKMWGMYDLLFADQSHLELQSLYSRARLLSLDGKLFEECLSGRASSVVATDFADGTEAGMNATPGFFVGVLTVTGELAVKKRIRGPQPFSAFQEVLEPLLHSNGG